jgi:hypothetical protein
VVTLAELIGALGGSVQLDQLKQIGDADYNISPSDRIVAPGQLTSSRTFTLPTAGTVTAGHPILTIDILGGVNALKTLSIAAGGTDRINGVPGATVTINVAFGIYYLVSDGVSAWDAQLLGGVSVTPGGGMVSSVSAPCSQLAITAFGTVSAAECVNQQTGSSYAIQDADLAKLITASNAAAQAYSIAPAGAASLFQSGWYVDIRNNSTNPAGEKQRRDDWRRRQASAARFADRDH